MPASPAITALRPAAALLVLLGITAAQPASAEDAQADPCAWTHNAEPFNDAHGDLELKAQLDMESFAININIPAKNNIGKFEVAPGQAGLPGGILRTEPSIEAPAIMKKIPLGIRARAEESKGEWLKVAIPPLERLGWCAVSGWIPKSQFLPHNEPPPPTLPENPTRDQFYAALKAGTLPATLVEEIKAKAAHGDAQAQAELGAMYTVSIEGVHPYKPQGITFDYAKSIEWYKKSADQGNPEGERGLGIMLVNGLGTPATMDGARWLEKAAKQGDIVAMRALGQFFINGNVWLHPNDEATGHHWLNLAAAQTGDESAKRWLQEEAQAAVVAERRMWGFIFGAMAVAVLGILVALVVKYDLLTNPVMKREKLAAQEKEAEHRKGCNLPVALERLPAWRFFRFPYEFAVKNPDRPNFQEGAALWENALRGYADAPKSEIERKEREAEFWQRHMESMINKDGSAVNLLPKQEIIDRWWVWEKWVFRGYYAATGIFYGTIFDAEYHYIVTQYEETKTAFNRVMNWRGRYEANPYNMGRKEQYDKAENKMEQLNEKMKSHKERWGEWYFFNVEQAYNERYGNAKPDTPPEHPANMGGANAGADPGLME